MSKFLKSIDILGNTLTLRLNKDQQQKSCLGGTLTIILFMIIIACLINFGWQIFSLDRPKIVLSTAFQNMSYFNLTGDFPLMLSIVRRGSKLIDNFASVYNFSAVTLRQNGQEIFISYPEIGLCKEEDYNGKLNIFMAQSYSQNLSNFFCLKQKNQIEIFGAIGSQIFSYLAIRINRCVNGTKIICKPREVIDMELNNVYLNLLLPNYYFDAANFKEPGKFYALSPGAIPISNGVYKRGYYYYKNVDYITDEGLIFESKISHSFYQFHMYSEMNFFSNDVAQTPDTISEIAFTTTQLKDIHDRSYYKLQNFAADVGGIIKAVLVAFSFTANLLSSPVFYVDIIENTLNLNIDYDALNESNINGNKNKVILPEINSLNKIQVNNVGNLIKNTSIQSLKETSRRKTKVNFIDVICFCTKPKNEQKRIEISKKLVENFVDLRSIIIQQVELNLIKNMILSTTDRKHIFNYMSRVINNRRINQIVKEFETPQELHQSFKLISQKIMSESDLENVEFLRKLAL